ncbi:pectate lyase [Piscinibacter sakaiensis]|uniref:pectate lyase n=1 Tax=Piscinibacter sakaiensis TaxID=1547922 RepID=UPI003AAB3A7F
MSRTAATSAALLLLALGNTPLCAQEPAAGRAERDQPQQPASTQRGNRADHLSRSRARMAADKAVLAAERYPLTGPLPEPVATGRGLETMPLDRPADWYGSAAARQVADNIISFQTPAGGWGKNQPRDRPPRLPGQWFVAVEPGSGQPSWRHVGSIDNGATVTEIRFLVKVAEQLPDEEAAVYRASALRGIGYLFDAQYPAGGWPQVWPLQGGYHDAITLNDDAMVNVAELLGEIARGEPDWRFVPADVRSRAVQAEQRAIDALLQLQVVIDGRKTLWAQHYDAVSHAPVGARAYEPAALASAESARVLLYLMALPAPGPRIVDAVESGIATLQALAIENRRWQRIDGAEARSLLPQAGAPLLWARFHDLTTLQPIFGDRDGRVHHDVEQLSVERRNGYAWFGHGPARAIARYADWPARRR